MDQCVARVRPRVSRRWAVSCFGALFGRNTQPAIRREFHRTLFTFYMNERFRKAVMLNATGVTKIARHGSAVTHPHHYARRILTPNLAMNLVRLAINARRFSKKKTRHVQDVAAHVSNDELLDRLEKRLVVEHGKAVAVIDSRAKRLTHDAGIQNFLQFTNRRLPPPILVHAQWNIRSPANRDHFFSFSNRRRQWLLANDRSFVSRSQMDEPAVCVHIRDEVEEIGLLALKQILRALVNRRHPKFASQRFGFTPRSIAQRDAVRTG